MEIGQHVQDIENLLAEEGIYDNYGLITSKDRSAILRAVLEELADQLFGLSSEGRQSKVSIAIAASMLVLREGEAFGSRWQADREATLLKIKQDLAGPACSQYIRALLTGVVQVDRAVKSKFPAICSIPDTTIIMSPAWLVEQHKKLQDASNRLHQDTTGSKSAASDALLWIAAVIYRAAASQPAMQLKVPSKKATKGTSAIDKADKASKGKGKGKGEEKTEEAPVDPTDASSGKAATAPAEGEGKGKGRQQRAVKPTKGKASINAETSNAATAPSSEVPAQPALDPTGRRSGRRTQHQLAGTAEANQVQEELQAVHSMQQVPVPEAAEANEVQEVLEVSPTVSLLHNTGRDNVPSELVVIWGCQDIHDSTRIVGVSSANTKHCDEQKGDQLAVVRYLLSETCRSQELGRYLSPLPQIKPQRWKNSTGSRRQVRYLQEQGHEGKIGSKCSEICLHSTFLRCSPAVSSTAVEATCELLTLIALCPGGAFRRENCPRSTLPDENPMDLGIRQRPPGLYSRSCVRYAGRNTT